MEAIALIVVVAVSVLIEPIAEWLYIRIERKRKQRCETKAADERRPLREEQARVGFGNVVIEDPLFALSKEEFP
jgi:hypothetical protein